MNTFKLNQWYHHPEGNGRFEHYIIAYSVNEDIVENGLLYVKYDNNEENYSISKIKNCCPKEPYSDLHRECNYKELKKIKAKML